MKAGREFVIKAVNAPVSIAGDLVNLYAYEFDYDKDLTLAAKSLFMVSVERHEVCPSFQTITRGQAQVLMDDLWSCGLRPTEGTGSAGSLKATQEHLEDLKTLLFHKMGIR